MSAAASPTSSADVVVPPLAAAPPDSVVAKTTELTEQIADIVATSIILNGWSFYYNNEEVDADKVANPRCLLPAILWQAEKLHRQSMLGNSFGVRFRPDEGAFIGAAALLLPEPGRPRGPLPLFCLETLYLVQENFPMPGGSGARLDPLVNAFFADHDAGIIPWADLDAAGTDASRGAGAHA